jgi:hypothetical protein
MSMRQEALTQIADIARRNNLTVEEVAAALAVSAPAEQKSANILSRIFGYIGGILVFAGLCLFVSMKWDELGSIGRVLITLGPGFCAFVLALVCISDTRLEKASTALFLAAAILEPTGILVALKEYSHGGDPAHGVLFMCAVMVLQQGFVFIAKQRTVLAFTTIFFALSFLATAFDIMNMEARYVGLIIGFMEMCLGWSLARSRHNSIAPLSYFFGATSFLSGAYNVLYDTPLEIFFLGLCCVFIYISIIARSRIVLIISTLSMLGYIGYFSEKNFTHTIGWPITLILLGVCVIASGIFAMKLNTKYIKQAK